MPSQQESDHALVLADISVRDLVSLIRCGEADGQTVVDQAHEIARQVVCVLLYYSHYVLAHHEQS